MLCSPYYLFDKKCSNHVKYYYTFSILIYFKIVYSCNCKAEFVITSVFSNAPSEIILICWLGHLNKWLLARMSCYEDQTFPVVCVT